MTNCVRNYFAYIKILNDESEVYLLIHATIKKKK